MNETALKVLKKINSNGYQAYLVGGYPRDIYIGRDSRDFAICTSATPKELKSIFGNDNRIEMEIGCGKGRFINELARRNPDVNYIAVEKSDNVIVQACEASIQNCLNNILFISAYAEYLPRLIKQDIHCDGERDGDEEAKVHRGMGEHFIHADTGHKRRLLDIFGTHEGLVVEVVFDQLVDQIHRDVVHHDAGDNLVDVKVRLHQAGNGAPDEARDTGGKDRHDPLDGGGDPGAQTAHHDGHEGADDELAGGADVKDAGLEGERDGQTQHDVGGRVVQHVTDAAQTVREAALQHHEEAGERAAGVEDEHDNEADEQAANDGHNRRREAMEARVFHKLFHFTSPLFAPDM